MSNNPDGRLSPLGKPLGGAGLRRKVASSPLRPPADAAAPAAGVALPPAHRGAGIAARAVSPVPDRASGSRRVVTLTGENLTPQALMAASADTLVELSPEAWRRIREGRESLMRAVRENETVYGVNTGFGSLANTVIPGHQLKKLQLNLIRSHAAGRMLACGARFHASWRHADSWMCGQVWAHHSLRLVSAACSSFASMCWRRASPASPRRTWSGCWHA